MIHQNHHYCSTSSSVRASSIEKQVGETKVSHSRINQVPKFTPRIIMQTQRLNKIIMLLLLFLSSVILIINSTKGDPQQGSEHLAMRQVISLSEKMNRLPPANLSNKTTSFASTSSTQQGARTQPHNPRSSWTAANLIGVRQHWRQMEKALSFSLTSWADQLRIQLSELQSNSTSPLSATLANNNSLISSGCRVALAEVVDKFRDGSLWASQMLDSSAKLPSGLFDGTLTEMGNFDGCLAVRSSGGSSIQGQYCTISIKPHLIARPRLHTACQKLPTLSASSSSSSSSSDGNSSLSLFKWMSQNSHQFYYAGLRLGICAPHKCSRNDLQLLLANFVSKFDLNGQVKSCQTTKSAGSLSNQDNLDLSQRIIIFIILTLMGLSLLGTLLDCCFSRPTQAQATSSRIQMKQPRRWQYQVNQQDSPCNECTHPALGLTNNLALWTCSSNSNSNSSASNSGSHQTKEDPLSSCPAAAAAAAATRRAELVYDCGCDEDEEKDESWIVKLEQNQRSQVAYVDHSGKEIDHNKDSAAAAAVSGRSLLFQILECFSIKQNLKTIGKQVPTATAITTTTTTSSSSSSSQCEIQLEDIKVIHGLRTLTMIWIIFGHTIGLVNPEMMNNLFALAQLSCSSRFLQALLNATLAVNTFFMISGVVTMISLVRRCQSAAQLVITDKEEKKKKKRKPQVQVNHHHYHHPSHLNHTQATTSSSISSSGASSCVHQIEADSVAEVDSISVASSGQSSGVSSNRRCIHSTTNNDKRRTRHKEEHHHHHLKEAKQSGYFFPSDYSPILWLLMRYLRLTPAYALVIGISILMPALGDGPFWLETAGQLGSTCKQNWHLNLLYVNNLLETDKLCLIHSWYLSNDWQFFVLTLLLLGLAYKSKRMAILLAVTLALASMATTFAVTVVNEFPPTIVTTSPAVAERWQFIHQLYYKPWPHLNSYLIGLLVGYFIITASKRRNHLNKKQKQHSKWRLILGSFLVVSLSIVILNSIYPWNMGYRVDPILTGLHSATFRTLWATCCGWLLYQLACHPRFWLAKLLAWPGFQLTSRLTYCTYLIHPLVIYYHFGTLRERIDSSMYAQFNRFLATLSLSYIMALVLSLIIESPSIRLQHLLATWFCPPKAMSQHKISAERNVESSGSSNESATTADSWHVMGLSSSTSASRDISDNGLPLVNQLGLFDHSSSLQVQSLPTKPTETNTPTALDAEFQRKLAQAIGRGFRIRSKIANATRDQPNYRNQRGVPVASATNLLAEPTSMGLMQNPLQKFQLAASPPRASDPGAILAARRSQQPAESLGTFSPTSRILATKRTMDCLSQRRSSAPSVKD